MLSSVIVQRPVGQDCSKLLRMEYDGVSMMTRMTLLGVRGVDTTRSVIPGLPKR